MAFILVVEDDAAVRDVLVEFLGEQCHEILATASAAEARDTMAARSVELVIADCVLYGEQGEALAQYAAASGVPAILITGDRARLMAAREMGLVVLWKPFRLAELDRVIAHLLGRAGEACPGGTAND